MLAKSNGLVGFGSWSSQLVSPPVTTREMPEPIRVARTPRSGGTSATSETWTRLTVRR